MPSTPEQSAGESHDPWGVAPARMKGGKKKKGASSKLRVEQTKKLDEEPAPASSGLHDLLSATPPVDYPVEAEPAAQYWESPNTRVHDELFATIEEAPQELSLSPSLLDDAPPIDDVVSTFVPEPPPEVGVETSGISLETILKCFQDEPVLCEPLPAPPDELLLGSPVNHREISRPPQASPPVSPAAPPMEDPQPATHRIDITPLPSPPNARERVVSYQHASGMRSHSAASGPQPFSRRAPAFSHHPHTVHAGDPPLPHHPQAHFYSAPHAPSMATRKRGKRSASTAQQPCYIFDTLVAAGGDGSDEVDNALLVGGHGTLDVFRVEREHLGIIGHLQKLPGRVIGAKLLPRRARDDGLQDRRPLVVLTIYGPCEALESPRISSPEHEYPPTRTSSRARSNQYPPGNERSQMYRTTVEVYSLKTQERVAVLFATPPVAASDLSGQPRLLIPPPTASLRVDANAKHVVVASGTSGEMWIFELSQQPSEESAFRCVAKIWTAIQPNTPVNPAEASIAGGSVPGRPLLGRPIFSLGHRWLAYVPAKPSSHPPLDGEPLLAATHPKPPGLSTHTAPPQPSVTCAVDTPDGDGLLNRVAREVTQEVIKGARWVSDQGWQAWRSYWNKPTPSESGAGVDGPTPGGETHAYTSTPNFPPTHAHANHQSQASGEPMLVSILDLARLYKTGDPAAQRLSPIATFQAPLGCSFLSFAPGGLQLLTASKNGDVQYIWDLMRIGLEKSGLPTSSPKASKANVSIRQGPHVRQVAHFSRMTAASIVDVVWTAPEGGRLAIVTEKGTVHMFDLPASAFQWPPPRRMTPSATAAVTDDNKGANRGNALYHATGAAGHTVSAAVKMVNNTAQPLLAAARGRRSSSGQGAVAGGLAESPTSTRSAQGTRIMAHGLSKSLGAASETINVLRSIGENRLHLPHGGSMLLPGCVKWLTGKESGLIGMVGDGLLRIHEIRIKTSTSKASKRQSLTRGLSTEHEVPSVTNQRVSSEERGGASGTDESSADAAGHTVTGYWHVRSRLPAARGNYERQHPLSQAEIETNSPYQPFHTDRRVALFTYEDPAQPGTESNLAVQLGMTTDSWVFGLPIPSSRLNVGGVPSTEHDVGHPEPDLLGPMESVLQRGKDADETEQLVITTRRRRRAKEGVGEDGFFEDDCEVLDFASDRV
ncbi:MAG: pre-mRNA-splicing factor cwc22 [Watsoniomyces obsoletus]|nr:MAG: pre-mRNA-splicing factor cwc22 [Watsoniomyces obsoletus]